MKQMSPVQILMKYEWNITLHWRDKDNFNVKENTPKTENLAQNYEWKMSHELCKIMHLEEKNTSYSNIPKLVIPTKIWRTRTEENSTPERQL